MSVKEFQYRVWCVTEDAYVDSDWAFVAPTTCPHDAGHTIDENKTAVIAQQNAESAPAGASVVHGARLKYVSGTELEAGVSGEPSQIVDVASDVMYGWSGVLSLDTTTTGAGGLASGESISDGNWLQIYAIADTTLQNSMALLASFLANPAMPSGYDWKYRIGVVRLDISDNIVRFLQRGTGDERYYWFDVNQSNLQILDGGSALSWTEIDMSAYRPPTAFRMKLRVEVQNLSSANVQAGLRPHGSSITDAVFKIKTGDGQFQQVFLDDFVVGSNGNLDYIVDEANTDLSIWSCGFVDEI